MNQCHFLSSYLVQMTANMLASVDIMSSCLVHGQPQLLVTLLLRVLFLALWPGISARDSLTRQCQLLQRSFRLATNYNQDRDIQGTQFQMLTHANHDACPWIESLV